jgi:hypothetical protein
MSIPSVAAHMLYVKQLYPPIHDREVVRILQRKFADSIELSGKPMTLR